MKTPRPDTLFRIGGLVACGIVALPLVSRALTGDIVALLANSGVTDAARLNLPVIRRILAAIPIVTAVIFGGAFWLNTREASGGSKRRAIVLLVSQAVIAVLSISDYFIIVAAQAPFVFTPSGAFA